MKRPCNGPGCDKYRIHHERPDEPRGVKYVDAPDDYPLDKPVYCSITCALMGGAISMKRNKDK